MKWEVRIMRSGKSCFDLTVYRKTFTRFWPLWAVNLVIWLFILPFNGLMQLGDDAGRELKATSLYRFARNVGDFAGEFGLIFALFAGLIVAMAVCSHMYNNRSANFMGALPVRREGMFVSTYLAGLTMLIAPNVVIFLLTLLVEAVGGAVVWLPLLYWLAALCGMEFFFYSFAVCLGQFTGHVLVLPVFYAVFNVLVAAAYALLNWVMRAYYFGFYGMDTSTGGLIYWCTPVMALLDMDIRSSQSKTNVWVITVENLWIVGVYAIVAVVLTACALLLYRRRHLETAGDIVAVKAMRPVFKYGVAACAGLFLGMLMHEMFGFTQLGLMIAVILWGIVGYFVAQMLLDKTIRVFKKWKGAAAMTAAFLILFAVIGFDLTGYETRVPAASEVHSVGIVGLYGYPNDSGSSLHIDLTSEESIADVVALHEAIVKYGEEGEPGEDGNYSDWTSVNITYVLKSGGLMARKYQFNLGSELGALAQKLRDNEEVRYKTYELDVVESWQQQGAQLEVVTVYQNRDDQTSTEIWGSTAMMLWDAVMEDFEAGNIGVHVMQDEQAHYDEIMIPDGTGGKSECQLEFRWALEIGEGEGPGNTKLPLDVEYAYYKDTKYWYMQIAVLDRSAKTLEILDQMLSPDNRYQDDPNDNPLWRSEG